MTDLQFAQMREFIVLAEEFAATATPYMPQAALTQAVVEDAPAAPPAIISDLQDLCFKLRSYVSNEDENALGMEMGMQRSADMIENLIRRHTEGD